MGAPVEGDPVAETARVSPIDIAFDTDADPAMAWHVITDPARVAEWFTDASPLGPVGSTYRLDFGDGSVVAGEVLALEPGHGFAHAWHWDGADPSETTTVAWTVTALPGDGSRIRLVHDGWGEAGLDASTRDDHEGYWTGYLDDLRDLLSGA